MADKDDEEGRYEHEIEGLDTEDPGKKAGGGGEELEYELVDDDEEEEASRAAAGEDDEDEEARRAREAEEAQGGGPDIDAEIARALERQEHARTQQELDELRAEVKDLRERQSTQASEQDTARLDSEIESARKQLTEAAEAGDTARQADLQDKLVDLRVQKATAKSAGSASDKGSEDKERRPADTPRRRMPEVPPAVRQWLGKNRWYVEGKHPEARETAAVIEQSLIRQGMDPSGEAFYTALDARLQKIHPEVAGGGREAGNGKEARKDKRGPTNGVSKAGGRSSGRVRITKTDVANMHACGLDPDDPEVLKQYAREKKSLEAREKRS